jgi:hypothetical protein
MWYEKRAPIEKQKKWFLLPLAAIHHSVYPLAGVSTETGT